MAWYTAQATINVEVEADNEEEARARLQTLIEKRVCEQRWGETAYVRQQYSLTTPETEPSGDCQHCGLPGGH